MALDLWVWNRDRSEKCPGVRVLRVIEQSGARACFNHLTQIHHQHPLTDMTNHGQVVRDKNQRETELLLQVAQQIDDLGLDRNVERRNRLVADDDARAKDQGACDADALALPAGEFVRVAIKLMAVESNSFDERADPVQPVSRRQAGLVGTQGLRQDLQDIHPRIE
jgi:hypothetical protein